MASNGLDLISLRIAPVHSSEYICSLSTVILSSPKTPLHQMSPKGKLMVLPVDVVLVAEPAFCKQVEVYAEDEDKFFKVCTASAYSH
jgi:hypothetical protein